LPDDRSEWEVRVGLFATREQAEDVLSRAFVSPRGQLLNQSPELRDC